MKDLTLERIWRSRKAIAEKCGYDSRRLVKFLQDRQSKREAENRNAPDGPAERHRK